MNYKTNLLAGEILSQKYLKDRHEFAKLYESARNGLLKIIDVQHSENTIQSYLKENPELLLNAGLCTFFPFARKRCALFSKVKLGECFETDFAFVHADSTGACWHFIELEKADVKLFNKNGDLSAKLSHALRQVTDWQIWLKDNRAYAINQLSLLQTEAGITKDTSFCVDPSFYIIMGRRSMLNEDVNRRRVELCNSNPRLDILTYDRLMEPIF